MKAPLKGDRDPSDFPKIKDKYWKAGYVEIPRAPGRQNLTDLPTNYDIRRLMPLPWPCRRCGEAHLMYTFRCVRCGFPTPLAAVNWRA